MADRIQRAFDVRVDDTPGHFTGYASVFGVVDTYDTVFDQGCFKKTVRERKGHLPVVWMHLREKPIGLAAVLEDEKGLLVDGQLDLDVQQGRETYSGMKKGYITEMSHSFKEVKFAPVMVNDVQIMHFKEVRSFEISPVTMNFGSNDEALISSVRTDERAVISSNLALADKGTKWDKGAANKRVQAWAENDDGDVVMAKYRRAFLWVDGAGENLTDFKFPIGDVIDGSLKAIPQAIYSAAGRIDQAKGVSVAGIKAELAKYYAKLGETPPWKRMIIPVRMAFEAGRLEALLREPPVGTLTGEPRSKPGDHLRAFQAELDRVARLLKEY